MSAKQPIPPLPEIKAGQNVIATIDGKERQLYCVQIVDGVAELQGKEKHQVKVADLKPA